ncbi:murein transglycosylase A [Tepidiphilus baoligensis]|uniref:murein transglycosylase A n=1 Tax=Tepidiphilus baoligensis TaxID=2698687 RepID=UPI0015B3D817|nr:MltA domain-containing protein [Tepidiphilus baoligensis]
MTPLATRPSLLLALLLSLAACTRQESPTPPEPCVCPPATTQPAPPHAPAPALRAEARAWSDLPGWREDRPSEAWVAFLAGCPRLEAIEPAWQAVCREAREQPREDAVLRRFLERRLRPWQLVAVLPDGGTRDTGLATGYYEPLIAASRTPDARHRTPILGPPADLVTVDLGEIVPATKHLRLKGRLEGNRLVPYYSRAEIRALGERLPAPILFWAADELDFFFLQIQGSGLLRLTDGSTVRIGYADHNGHPYRSIGRLLIDAGELTLPEASAQGIRRWLERHPEQRQALLDANPAYVFFRELPPDGPGPIGTLGVPLTPQRSLAVDPALLPLGAPLYAVVSGRHPLSRLMLAQDTGGAIQGPLRVDVYEGSGQEAGERAGRRRDEVALWLLWPTDADPPAARQ